MDERDQNPLTISDILEQLVKPSVIQGGTQAPQPKPIVPPPTPPLSKQGQDNISLPQLNKQTLQGPGLKPPDGQIGRPSDRRQTIRTMSGDLARLKQGLTPLALELGARKNTGNLQPKEGSPTTKTQNIPPEAIGKPSLPQITDRPIDIQEKPSPPRPQSSFLNQKLVVPPVVLPSLPPNRPAHIHEETRILDKDNLPAFLGAPIPKRKAPRPEDEKVEYGVIAKVIGSGMTTGIVSTMVLALVAYGLIYYFFLREEVIIPTTTPTPTPVNTIPPVQINELEEIFRTTPITTFSLPPDPTNLIPEFQLFLEQQTIAQKEFKRIKFLPVQSGEILTFTKLFDGLAIKYPAELNNWINNNNIVFLYGQMENFSDKNKDNKRVVFVVEIKDPARVTGIIKNWETTMADDLKNFFNIDPSRGASTPFLDNEYRTVKIRYKNFPLPDRTIDYAIVSSLTGRYYLILTNSRESIYSPIDKIKGL
ncbi:MAG: hypothetical protein Q7S43_01115 [bacterium]|nr:hypothetical protein [bacterium]